MIGVHRVSYIDVLRCTSTLRVRTAQLRTAAEFLEYLIWSKRLADLISLPYSIEQEPAGNTSVFKGLYQRLRKLVHVALPAEG